MDRNGTLSVPPVPRTLAHYLGITGKASFTLLISVRIADWQVDMGAGPPLYFHCPFRGPCDNLAITVKATSGPPGRHMYAFKTAGEVAAFTSHPLWKKCLPSARFLGQEV